MDITANARTMTTSEPVAYAASGLPGQPSSLVDMLHRMDELEVIPQMQIAQNSTANSDSEVRVQVVSNAHSSYCEGGSQEDTGQPQQDNVYQPQQDNATLRISSGVPTTLTQTLITEPSITLLTNTIPSSSSQPLSHPPLDIEPVVQQTNHHDPEEQPDKPFPRVGRPRTRPPRERHEWHYHLGGVRHCRVPLSPDHREVLEVAYVSRIMSKNFRKEGQPEKERIAKITGMDIDKVQEWFKNRRKKDRLLQDRALGRNLPKGNRSGKSTTSDSGNNIDQLPADTPAGLVVEIPPDGGVHNVIGMNNGNGGVDISNRPIPEQFEHLPVVP